MAIEVRQKLFNFFLFLCRLDLSHPENRNCYHIIIFQVFIIENCVVDSLLVFLCNYSK